MKNKLNSIKKSENKVLLEVIAVYTVLALALIGVYYIDPAITGFAILNETLNESNETINIENRLNETQIINNESLKNSEGIFGELGNQRFPISRKIL
jgi:predicted PurR-regulated permease PerM|tara:strand:+ start:192 stop:482 length:291 start_codon:yes stop_codon:yes gene_type:complete